MNTSLPSDDRAQQAVIARARQLVEDVGARGQILDIHCHVGRDADGSAQSALTLQDELDALGGGSALVFALKAVEGYGVANQVVADAIAAATPDRFDMLWRVDPNAEDAVRTMETGLAAGARGLKLHPASDAFDAGAPCVTRLLDRLEERGGIVLIHTGVDAPGAALAGLEHARTHPGITVVLAHAGAFELAQLVPLLRDVPNCVVDTSWWSPVDLAALLTRVAPRQIVYGSDPPYGQPAVLITAAILVARTCGWSDEAIVAMLGGNARRIIGDACDTDGHGDTRAGDSLWHPMGTLPPATIGTVALERAYTHLIVAFTTLNAGGDARADLRVAGAALAYSSTERGHRTRDLIDLALHRAEDGDTRDAAAVVNAAIIELFCAIHAR